MKNVTLLLLLAALPAFAQGPGTPRHFLGVTGPLTPPSSLAPREIALQHLRSLAQELSLSPADLDSIYIAKQYRSANNGVTHFVLRQRFGDVDVWNAEWVVNIDSAGRVLNAGGSLYPAPDVTLSLPATSRATAAVRSAVAAVNPALKDRFAPFPSREAPRMRHGVRFAAGPLARDAEGAPVWYAERGKLRPAWNFFVADSDRVHRYSVTVDDESQAILNQQPLTFFQSVAVPPTPHGLVFDRESPQPNPTPGVQLAGPPAVVARVLAGFQGDPVASLKGWTDGIGTAGNNVIAGENLTATDFVSPVPTLSTNGDFSFPLLLGAGFYPLAYRDSAVTNLFYWMNRAHDLHYQYGFDEQAGNFQTDNFGRGGVGGDAVFAYAHYGSQRSGAGEFENSFFSLDGTDDDGAQPEVSMFISGGAGPNGDLFTDGSYDAQVMVHEYTHGVSSRLARQVYSTFQGASMGEAWSDFYALEYTIPMGAPPDGVYPVGEYFDQSWGHGIRSRPYSTNTEIDPLTFANLGHVSTTPEVHADGEIWVAALWEIRANLIAQFGEQEGRNRVRQLVIDGMKLAVPQSSMVDMRDAILLADRVDYQGASQTQLWTGFAKRGLGAMARAQDGTTVHVISSFDMPSPIGALKFYDDSIVIGEPVRVVLQDSNYNLPSVLIQLTGSSGDLENLILHQYGSIYEGTMGTALATVALSNSRLELVTGDDVSAYYVDLDTGSGAAKLIQATIPAAVPYSFNLTTPAFTFIGETRRSIGTGARLNYQLPFSFPFFDKTYGSVIIFANGLLAFELPAQPGVCADFVNLRNYHGIAPLWTYSSATSLVGSAQPNEGLFISTGGDSVTFRWAGEYTAVDQGPSPTNFAATLFKDGRIQFNYGAGNQSVMSPASFSECAPPSVGIANGHDVYSQTFSFGGFTNQSVMHFGPPYHFSSLPSGTITAPEDGDHVQDILTISGTSADSITFVSYIDIYIDGVLQSHISSNTAAWSAVLNLGAAKLVGGAHTLWARVTNSRGGFTDIPAKPLTFTVDPGLGSLPVIGIDQPGNGDTITGILSVRGYAYDPGLRITSVDTLIDGLVYSSTNYGLNRSDICGPLTTKPVNCPAVGFLAAFDTVEATPPIPDGAHTMQVRAHDQTGRVTLYPVTPLAFTVKNGPAAPVVGVLESPQSDATLSGTVKVSGYVYSTGQKIVSGIVVIDGALGSTVTLGQARPDVCPALPAADACPNIGFTFMLDTTKLLNGPHTLGIEGINGRGDYAIFPTLVKNGINVQVRN